MSKLTADIEANLALFIQETQESQLVWVYAMKKVGSLVSRLNLKKVK